MKEKKIYKAWDQTALSLIKKSALSKIPIELNEIDWKQDISPNKDQLRKHLSAFANYPGGGFLVFGINRKGKLEGIHSQAEANSIVGILGNIARDGIEPTLSLEHSIKEFKGHQLLFIRINESQDKPVHLRGKGFESSYIRSAGESRKMSRSELAQALMSSRGQSYEMGEAILCETAKEVFKRLDISGFYQLQGQPLPSSEEKIMADLKVQKLINQTNNRIAITHLGVISCANNLLEYEGHDRHAIRIILYSGTDRLSTIREISFSKGYAVGYQELVKTVMDILPGSEVIKEALRKEVRVYPEIAIREIIANALIHQDLMITGMNLLVEVFSDRVEITNPGKLLPSIAVDRLIDTTQESRNENLARLMRRLGICEERGSGIDKAIAAIELFNLPPIEFRERENSFKVTLFAPRKYKSMSQEERIRACYQHCVLCFMANKKMTNTSLRQRLGISEQNYPMVSRVIKDALSAKKIKKEDPTQKGNKNASYIPFWA